MVFNKPSIITLSISLCIISHFLDQPMLRHARLMQLQTKTADKVEKVIVMNIYSNEASG